MFSVYTCRDNVLTVPELIALHLRAPRLVKVEARVRAKAKAKVSQSVEVEM